MKILARYVFRTVFAPMVWCLTVFIGLYIMVDLLGHLDEILRYHVHGRILLLYYGTMVPLVFVQVAPFACLMATLYALGNLNRHQELMAMRASGVDPWTISRPLIWMGLFMSLAVLVVNETVAPQAALITNSIKENYMEQAPPPGTKRPKKLLKTIQHLTAYGQQQTLLYAETFDPVEKRMTGIVILQHGPSLTLRRKITAESAEWTDAGWRFLNGTILQFNANGQAVGRPVPFAAKIIRAGDRPKVLEKSEAQAAFMNTPDLYGYIRNLQVAGGATIRKLWVDLYAKPASAFACLAMILIGIPFSVQPVRGGGAALGLSLGLGVGLAFYATNSLTVALGKGGILPPLLAAWISLIGFAVWGAKLTWRRLA